MPKRESKSGLEMSTKQVTALLLAKLHEGDIPAENRAELVDGLGLLKVNGSLALRRNSVMYHAMLLNAGYSEDTLRQVSELRQYCQPATQSSSH